MKIDGPELEDILAWPRLIDAIHDQFVEGCDAPERHHHTVATNTAHAATMLLMPAFQRGAYIGLKIVNVFPDNGDRGLPSITANYLLYSGETGEMLAMLDGGVLTARRTAAAAALGARFLAREDARRLLVVGAGRVARLIPGAMRAVRPIDEVVIWNRNLAAAEALAADLRAEGVDAAAAKDLEAAVRSADIVSCATLSTTPLIRGDWLRAGQHLDLIGGFTPKMREADDDAFRSARVYIDTPTAFTESGDVIAPIQSGAITADDVVGDLSALCQQRIAGRSSADEITLFKAVGTALEDFAAAKLAYRAKTAAAGASPQ